jgi:hypothetical protein
MGKARKQYETGSQLCLFFDRECEGDVFLSKSRFIFNGLHGVISQKIEHFINTAERTSDPTLVDKTVQRQALVSEASRIRFLLPDSLLWYITLLEVYCFLGI